MLNQLKSLYTPGCLVIFSLKWFNNDINLVVWSYFLPKDLPEIGIRQNRQQLLDPVRQKQNQFFRILGYVRFSKF